MTVVRVPLAALLLGSVACHTVQPLAVSAIPQTNPPVVFVTYKDNSQVAVEQPRVSGDSLYGTWQGLDEQLAVPLSAVQSIESFQKNGTRTALLIAGIAAATAGAVWTFSLIATGDQACDFGRGNTDQQGIPPPADAECKIS
jgi:hypothetical protein